MSTTTNKFSTTVRERAVRLILDTEGQHASRWQAVISIAAKIGCTAQTVNEWVKKAQIDSGRRAGIPNEMAEKMKALERENHELRRRTTSSARHRPIRDGGARPPVEVMVDSMSRMNYFCSEASSKGINCQVPLDCGAAS